MWINKKIFQKFKLNKLKYIYLNRFWLNNNNENNNNNNINNNNIIIF